jgi:hypothetical protein
MAKSTSCDFCGKPGESGHFQKRVALPADFKSARTARVQINIYLEDGALTIPDICEECRTKLANATPFVPSNPPVKPS